MLAIGGDWRMGRYTIRWERVHSDCERSWERMSVGRVLPRKRYDIFEENGVGIEASESIGRPGGGAGRRAPSTAISYGFSGIPFCSPLPAQEYDFFFYKTHFLYIFHSATRPLRELFGPRTQMATTFLFSSLFILITPLLIFLN